MKPYSPFLCSVTDRHVLESGLLRFVPEANLQQTSVHLGDWVTFNPDLAYALDLSDKVCHHNGHAEHSSGIVILRVSVKLVVDEILDGDLQYYARNISGCLN